MPVSRPTSGAGIVRAVWFGMRCDFTRRAITGAIESGEVEPALVVLPRAPKPLGTGWPEPPFDRWLRERGAAIVEVDRLAGEDREAVLSSIEAHRVAIGVGACFPFKVPESVRAALPYGVLNIHPSLLPRLRGPEPVFHAYRQGLAETGVTVHEMDDGWDSGPILAQERVPIPADGSAAELEGALARLGGEMLGRVARSWCSGDTQTVAQDERAASWAPVPGDQERTIPAGLTMALSARFVRACGPLVACDADTGELVTVVDAIPPDHRDFRRLRAEHGLIRARCRDGDLWLLRYSRRECSAQRQ